LLKRVKDSDKKVRLAAVLVLGKIQPTSEEAAQALRSCLADENEQVRKAAQDALDKMK
jgi:HEAT repeat protein